jgi:hypothetical protein
VDGQLGRNLRKPINAINGRPAAAIPGAILLTT